MPRKMVRKPAERKPKTGPRDEQAKAEIYADIVGRILRGELKPGQHLVEMALAERHGVSRTRIREVMFMLLRDGLVERLHNRGTRVVSFSPDDVEDIYEIRKSLECLALRSAVSHLPLEPLIEFDRQLRQLAAAKPANASKEHADIDLALHRFMISHSRNQRLITYLENLSQLIHSLRLIGYRQDEFVRQTGEEHLALVQALLRRDAAGAEEILAEHIEHSKRHALDLLIFDESAPTRSFGLAVVRRIHPGKTGS